MNILLRVLLFIFATSTLFFVLKKVRNSQTQIESVVFWVLFMLGLVIISIFPSIVIYISSLIGIESPANFVYLCIIFILLLRVFDLSLQLSKVQYQTQQLAQIIALEKSQPNIEKSLQDEEK